MNLPVMVLQSGWRPSAIDVSSARTASRLIFELWGTLGMALALGPYGCQELVPQLVTHCFGPSDRGGSSEFRILSPIKSFHFFWREPRVRVGQGNRAVREGSNSWGDGSAGPFGLRAGNVPAVCGLL